MAIEAATALMSGPVSMTRSSMASKSVAITLKGIAQVLDVFRQRIGQHEARQRLALKMKRAEAFHGEKFEEACALRSPNT